MRFPPRRQLIVPALLLASCITGAGVALSLEKGLPSVDALRDWRPRALTTVNAADGSVLARLGSQKRIVIPFDRVPKRFIEAIIATEDQHFYRHIGIDPFGIARAVVNNIWSLRLRGQGGSTITQQLARNLFLYPDKTPSRKAQEMVLALQIERAYSKEEILGFYCNQVHLGHGLHGIEAASQYYFSRPAKDLSLSQSALLAGIVQSPANLTPIRHPDRALRRRGHVLDRMQAEGYITAAEAAKAKAEPLALSVSGDEQGLGLYLVEEVRRALVMKYGEEVIYGGGLTVDTTLDLAAQRAAESAMREGILTVDRRRGFRTIWKNVASSGPLDRYVDPAWGTTPPEVGAVVSGLIVSASSTAARARIGAYAVELRRPAIAWTGRDAMNAIVKPGDLVPLRVKKRDDAHRTIEAEIEPTPSVQGALIALDPRNGEIRALVGGFDFARSEFDRATQARRQAGSAFKPFLFSAALDGGMTPSQTFYDEPTVLLEPRGEAPYQPENYYRGYDGLTTLREALEESRNIVSVLMLDEVGYRPVIERAREMGITTPLRPYPSMALGAFEVSLMEMTSAYSVFPNQGIRVAPHFIRRVRDRAGNVLEEVKPEVREVMSPETAFVMTWLLKGVTEEGTAEAAKTLGRSVAGKTGTTDDYSDAWFVGFSPTLVCGVWIGTDKKESLGQGRTGAAVALPPWMEFMKKMLADAPADEFTRPSGVELVPVDRRTGKLASAETGCPPEDVILEAFKTGTAPTSFCSAREHERLTLPYYLQRFEINERGELVASAAELAQVLGAGGVAPALSADHRSLELPGPAGPGTRILPLALDSAGIEELRSLLVAAPTQISGEESGPGGPWFGTDGRRAAVRMIHRN